MEGQTKQKLEAIRASMIRLGVEAWIISGQDPHGSEYPASHFAVREWLCGFAGSAGTIVISADQAALWADSRYWIEAAEILKDSSIALMKSGQHDCPTIADWLREQLPAHGLVACNESAFTVHAFNELAQELQNRDLMLAAMPDILDDIWQDRPVLPHARVNIFQPACSIHSAREKLDRLQAWMQDTGHNWVFIGALDDIAWLLNLRGDAIRHTPVFYAWLLIGTHGSTLFCADGKLDDAVQAYLHDLPIMCADYDSAAAFLQTLPGDDRMVVSPADCAIKLRSCMNHMKVHEQASVLALWKAVKEPGEIELLDSLLPEDAASVLKSVVWALKQGETDGVTESALADRIAADRTQLAGSRGESFPPIVGFGSNGAMVHYRPVAGKDALIKGRGLLLVDCGGQNERGTSDMTRVFLFGEARPEEKLAYTLVLKGQIALAKVVFPKGTTGSQLDVLARLALWKHGLQYGHGTGHGIGFFLCVHEGPQRISPSPSAVVLEPGMIVSNEPGYYQEGAFGIRLENMLVVEEHPDIKGFLCFRVLTHFPFEPALINLALLCDEELSWLRHYQEQCYKLLKPYLKSDDHTWLQKTAALPK